MCHEPVQSVLTETSYHSQPTVYRFYVANSKEIGKLGNKNENHFDIALKYLVTRGAEKNESHSRETE